MKNNKWVTLAFTSIFLIITLNIIASGLQTFPDYGFIITNNIKENNISINTNTYGEVLNIYAGRDTSAVVEQFFIGGNISFTNLDLNNSVFDDVNMLLLSFRKGTIDTRYWPHPLWPVPPGIFLTLDISTSGSDIENALNKAQTIKGMIEREFGLDSLVIYDMNKRANGIRIAFYLDFNSSTKDYTDLVNTWRAYAPSTGLGNLITTELIVSAPVSLVVLLLLRDEKNVLLPVLGDAYINPNGISMKSEKSFILSVNNVTQHVGAITHNPTANFSILKIEIPYIGNVTAYYPKSDNLFPDMTGKFEYIFSPEGPVNNSNPEDIWINYNFNYNNESQFPVLRAEFLPIPVTPIYDLNVTRELGFMIKVQNVGAEAAYNITTAIPVRPQDVENVNILGEEPVNITNIFLFALIYTLNTTKIRNYFEIYVQPELVDPAIREYAKILINNYKTELTKQNQSELITANKSVVYENMDYEPDYWQADKYNKAAIVGRASELAPRDNITFSFRIIIPGVKNITDPLRDVVNNMIYNSSVTLKINNALYYIPISDELKNETKNGILAGIEGLENRIISNITKTITGKYLELTIGPVVEYKDSIGHKFFIAGNGIVTQINEKEPVLLPTLTVDDYSISIDQNVTITLKLSNLGNENAENVSISLYYGVMNYGFNFRDKRHIETQYIGHLTSNETKTLEYVYTVRTSIGLHPIFAEITYKDDNGKELHVLSNVIYVIVFSKYSRNPRADYPFPTPELEIRKNVSNTSPKIGDIITNNITITNVGDEQTRIIVVDTINDGILTPIQTTLHIIRDGVDITNDVMIDVHKIYDSGGDSIIRVTVFETVTGEGAVGILLKPNQTLVIMYDARVKSGGVLYIYPIRVVYTSLHPVLSSKPTDFENETTTHPTYSKYNPFKIMQDDTENIQITSYSNSLVAIIEQISSKLPTSLKLIILGAIIMVISAIIVTQRKRKIIQAPFVV
ncbi:MAG: hypothetical protein ACP6IU_01280 [Candidatus Asgardarchaeia archaeon]